MEAGKLNYETEDVIKGYYEAIEQNIEMQNQIWQGILKLIITLASSMLVLSVAFVGKIVVDICFFIILSWCFLFLTIIFGVIAMLSEVISFHNHSCKQAKVVKEYERRLAAGESHVSDVDADAVLPNSIIWGVLALNAFFLAVACIFESLLYKHSLQLVWIIGVGAFVIFVVWLNWHLLGKYKEGLNNLQ